MDAEATKNVNVAPGAYKGMNVFDIATVAGHRLRLNFWVRNKDYVPTHEFYKTILKERRENDWENASLYRIGTDGSVAQNPTIFAPRSADAQVTNLGGLLTIRPKWDDRQRIKSEGESDFDVNIGSICLPPRNGNEVGRLDLSRRAIISTRRRPASAWRWARRTMVGRQLGNRTVRRCLAHRSQVAPTTSSGCLVHPAVTGSNSSRSTCFVGSEIRLPSGSTKGRRPETSAFLHSIASCRNNFDRRKESLN